MKRSWLGPLGEAPRAPADPVAADGEELATALHEVSNALTVMIGWLEVAQERAADGPTREAVELALTHARLGFGVARRAIGAEPPAGQDELSAAGLARAAVLAVTPRAQHKGVLLRLDSATGIDDHVADGLAVSQILLNLLLNAVAFTEAGGNVSLAVREADGVLVFQVRDQGPGVPPERAASLLSGGASTRDGGAGIGLRHSSDLALAHGGSLRLASPGPGACFELCWPKSSVRSRSRQAGAHPNGLAGSRILVLEDDPAVLGLIELGLEARGAAVVAISDWRELQSLGGERPLAAALLDLSPIADEPATALDALRSAIGEVPIVLITGSASGVPEAVQAAVRAWVRKPFEMGEVIDVLCSLVSTDPRAEPR